MNKKKRKKIAIIDCETDPFKYERIPKPFVWGYYDGEKFEYFWGDNEKSIEKFLLFLMVEEPDYIYAHNGGKFDIHFLLDYVDLEKDILVINSRFVEISIMGLKFRDSYAIIPEALGKISGKLDFDYQKMESNEREKYKTEIIEYLKVDCIELWKLVTAFIESYGNHLTAPSASLSMMRKIESVKIPKLRIQEDKLLRPYYYGGRTEVFKYGKFKGSINYIDIVSSYPFAMLSFHPFFNVWSSYDNPRINNIKGCNFYRVFAESAGALPERKENGGIHFPVKEGEFFVTGWELLTGLKTKTIKIKKLLYEIDFPETKNFKKFVDYFWDLKNNSKKGTPEYTFAKLMLNSCYGKFGTNPDKYHRYCITEDSSIIRNAELDIDCYTDYKDEIWEPHHSIPNTSKWVVKKDLLEDEKNFQNVAVSASITGLARSRLWEGIHAVKKSGNEVIYSDTDSIIYKGNKKIKGIPFGKNLGDWELEDTFTSGSVAGKKLYAFQKPDKKWKVASKGIRVTPDMVTQMAGDIGRMSVDPNVEIEFKNDSPVFSANSNPRFIKRTVKMT